MTSMKTKGRIAASARLIELYGFAYADIASVRTCFDIIAKRRGMKMILKFTENINSITLKEAVALQKLQHFFDADALVVAERGGDERLADNAYFTRSGIACLSIRAFENYLDGVDIPKAQKFFIGRRKLDSSKLKYERGISGLSIRKLANMVGISKDSLSRYEHGDTYVKKSTLNKLEKFFSASLSMSEAKDYRVGIEAVHAKCARPGKIGSAIRAFSSFIDGAPPFAALAEKGRRYEIGMSDDSRMLKRLAIAYGRVSTILPDDRQFIISDIVKSRSSNGIPIITKGEAKKSDERQLLELIESRRG